MKYKIYFFILFLFLASVMNPLQALSDSKKEIEKSLKELERLAEDIKQNSASIEALMKNFSAAGIQPSQDMVKVIKPVAPVRETDNVASRTLLVVRLNDEFPVLEQRDQWYHIALPDGRNGWIHEDVVQIFSKPSTAPPVKTATLSSTEIKDIMVIVEQLIQDTYEQKADADKIITNLDELFQKLPESEKKQLASLYQEFEIQKEKVIKYHIRADYFFTEYEPSDKILEQPAEKLYQGIDVDLSLNMGKTSHSTETKESQKSRDMSFNVRKMLGERSQVSSSFAHRNEVIQTPYSTTDFRLGYDYQSINGMTINTYAAYDGYKDESFSRNTFKNLGTGINFIYPFSETSQFYTDFNFESKNYKEEGGDDYNGGQFNTGLRLKTKPNTQLNFMIQGIVQSSDASYLNFNRFIPQVSYIQKKPKGTFNAKLEFENLGYDKEAKGNNYSREKLDVVWSKKGSTRRISLIGKQFNNNNSLSYLKLGGQMRWQKTQMENFCQTNLSLLMVYFPEGADRQVHYLDLRADRSNSGRKYVLDFSLFGRFWSKTEAVFQRDHVLDFYGRWGYKFYRIQIGPLVGGHLLLNKDKKVFRRDGNSIRLGIDMNGNFPLQRASLNLALRYERDIVFGNKISINQNTGETTLGDMITRNPSTLQVTVGFRAPLTRDLELKIDISQYKLKLDFDEETSLNPIPRKSRLVFLAGIGYRFKT